jgi:hypothetical protein
LLNLNGQYYNLIKNEIVNEVKENNEAVSNETALQANCVQKPNNQELNKEDKPVNLEARLQYFQCNDGK